MNIFCDVFLKMINDLHILGVHLVGSSLGGFLAQKFYELSGKSNACVKSLILCNTFIDTYSFESRFSSKLQVQFWYPFFTYASASLIIPSLPSLIPIEIC